jgi:hypothetical protein
MCSTRLYTLHSAADRGDHNVVSIDASNSPYHLTTKSLTEPTNLGPVLEYRAFPFLGPSYNQYTSNFIKLADNNNTWFVNIYGQGLRFHGPDLVGHITKVEQLSNSQVNISFSELSIDLYGVLDYRYDAKKYTTELF